MPNLRCLKEIRLMTWWGTSGTYGCLVCDCWLWESMSDITNRYTWVDVSGLNKANEIMWDEWHLYVWCVIADFERLSRLMWISKSTGQQRYTRKQVWWNMVCKGRCKERLKFDDRHGGGIKWTSKEGGRFVWKSRAEMDEDKWTNEGGQRIKGEKGQGNEE